MAYDQRSLDDYIDVAQRIADFREKYPEGTLAPVQQDGQLYKIVQAQGFDKDGTIAQQSFVVVIAAASRHPGDERPGIGMAWEIFPGRTPYTRGSELQNAETSAWGRAIIAVGASDSKRGIASREEVRNRQAERDDWNGPQPASQDCRDGLHNSACSNCRCHCHSGYPINKDGSLSRSRMTDEQKAAAGVMTDAEQRAHNQLAKPPANTQPVDRLTATPVDDAWYDSPKPLADVDNPEDRHGTATADQIRSLQARFAAIGVTDRHAKIAHLQQMFGPEVKSSKDLSYTQAATALQEMSRVQPA